MSKRLSKIDPDFSINPLISQVPFCQSNEDVYSFWDPDHTLSWSGSQELNIPDPKIWEFMDPTYLICFTFEQS